MRLVKVALAHVDTTVGAVQSNGARALELAREMGAQDVTLGAFQEQLLGGYPPEDLVQWRSFVTGQWAALQRFAEGTADLGTVFVLGLVVAHEAHRYNAAAVVHRGRVLGVVPKEKLPTYNVFYEARTFSRGRPGLDAELPGGVPFGDFIFGFDWGVLGVEVCEDGWSPDGPMRRRAYAGAEVVVNVSASPFRVGAQSTRREMQCTRSADNQCTVVYTNAVGGQDGLVFDGGGFVCQNGRLLLEAERFREGTAAVVVDLDRTVRLRAENTTWRSDALEFAATPLRPIRLDSPEPGADRSGLRFAGPPHRSFFLPLPRPEETPDPHAAWCEELLSALTLGLGDYFEKNGFKLIGIALSGGRDSMLALLITWRYLVRRFGVDGWREQMPRLVRTFYMPSQFSSEQTRGAAARLTAELGAPFKIIPIEEAFQREIAVVEAMLEPGEAVDGLTLQNIQARLRGQRMWNWSNSTFGLFLQTGNMSEKAVGYTTIGGDLEGGFSLISNLPKTVVIALLEHLLAVHGFEGIRDALGHPAGPELQANQEGEKELMPFPILDACFALHADEKLSPDEMVAALASIFPEVGVEVLTAHVQRFVKMFMRSIYKWVQAPLGLHLGNLDLDRERALQIPVVTSPEWTR